MCLALLWKTGFLAICIAAWLSQCNGMGAFINTPSEASSDLIQISSLVTIALARYSTSAEDLDTVVCFFVFHGMGDPPRVTK